jgi:hypothetical protein
MELRAMLSWQTIKMRVFVGYGYNARDIWVETHVVPLVQAFGWDVVHGQAVFGGALPEEVLKLIRASDAMIGFTTRREAVAGNQFQTHPWVVQELTMAYSQDPRIPFVEVRESGVISPGGAIEAADFQRIDYDESDRATCLRDIARALQKFRDRTRIITVRLRPASVVEQIGAVLDSASFTCTCQILRGAVELPPQKIPVRPIKQGLYVQLRGIAADELVRLSISAEGRRWRSDYDSVDTVDVELKA